MQKLLHPLQENFEIPLGRGAAAPPHLFRSFWLGGFESACQINRARQRLDLIDFTQHDRQARQDYRLLRDIGILTARDAARWHLIDRQGHYDFCPLEPLLSAASENGVQVIWNLCHYGWPDDLNLISPEFVHRFAAYAQAVAEFIKKHTDDVPFYCPINEISFLSWGAGHVGIMHPFYKHRGALVKRQLVRAAIVAMDAIRAVDPRARFVHAEPLINVVSPPRHPELAHLAVARTESQFEIWDMMLGRVAPELGGHPRYLDIAGVNFYHSNQWQYPGATRLHWHKHPRDQRWIPLHRMLAYFEDRYRCPLFISETSHVGHGRAEWLREIMAEVSRARAHGTAVEGICWYPILDRPDWDDCEHWHNSGVWDLERNGGDTWRRVPNPCHFEEFCRACAQGVPTITN